MRVFADGVHNKVAVRLLPLLLFLYVLAYLDRINVGFAQLQMQRDLGFSDTVYGFGAGVFFLGYLLCEIPSNLLLERFGARRWIARIMLSWGVVSTLTACTDSVSTFYWLRFLLGVAEAGFFPGIVYYLTQWFPLTERARAMALFMTATAVAGIVGGPVSGAFLSLDGALGLHGWQWLFVCEGIPTVATGLVVLRWLPDGPQDAWWLTESDRKHLLHRLQPCDGENPLVVNWKQAVLDPRSLLLSGVYLSIVLGFYTLSLWLPQIVVANAKTPPLVTGFLTAVPYVAAMLGMVVIGVLADAGRHRGTYVAGSALIGALGLLLSAVVSGTTHSGLTLFGLSLAACGIWGTLGPFWSLPAAFLQGRGLAAGIAMINSIGNLGGFFGPYLAGVLKATTGGFSTAFAIEATLLTMGGLTVFVFSAFRPGCLPDRWRIPAGDNTTQ